MTDTGIGAPPVGCPMHASRTLPLDGTPHSLSPTLAAWQEEAPATPFEYPDGSVGWIVTRHELAREIQTDPRFDTDFRGLLHLDVEHPAAEGADAEPLSAYDEGSLRHLINLHGDEHARIRRVALGRYSVKAARSHRPEIAEIVARQLDAFLGLPRPVDLVEHFARPITTKAHELVLGIPATHSEEFTRVFVAGPSSGRQMLALIRELLALKRKTPGDDALTDIARSELNPSEKEGLASTVMGTGRDAVEYMIGTAMVYLLTHRDQWNLLRDDPGLMPRAIEEFLRLGAMHIVLVPVAAREDVTINGFSVAAGEAVAVSAAAANQDRRYYERPHDFDITRDPLGHFGFGDGIHVCLGQQVARVEIAEAVGQLVARLPELRLVSAEPVPSFSFLYRTGPVVVDWD